MTFSERERSIDRIIFPLCLLQAPARATPMYRIPAERKGWSFSESDDRWICSAQRSRVLVLRNNYNGRATGAIRYAVSNEFCCRSSMFSASQRQQRLEMSLVLCVVGRVSKESDDFALVFLRGHGTGCEGSFLPAIWAFSAGHRVARKCHGVSLLGFCDCDNGRRQLARASFVREE